MHEEIPAPPLSVSVAEAFRYWLRLGFISFGGPAGQIAIMHEELVERRRWISERRYLHALNYCMLLPGPEAQQLATYIGWLLHGNVGGIIAGTLFVLPSLFILIVLTWIYLQFGQLPLIAGIFYGIKPAVVAIVFAAAYRIGSRALRNALLWGIALAAFVAIAFLHAPFPAIVVCAALLGVAGGRLLPRYFITGGHPDDAASGFGPALIDDDTPSPPHARPSRARVLRIAAAGLALWLAGTAILVLSCGLHGTLTLMGWFFTKAALVTFGGAYAVLPYVYQAAVHHYQWLSTYQMMDGLALGETTPGPLIMIVAFVGFVGNAGPAGAVSLAAGALGAAVATCFTFLPSFLFILGGAPLIEATREDVKLTAPLTAITAAVVGVVLNLGLFFALHVIWPPGQGGGIRWFPALLTLAALVVLVRRRANLLVVIGACALIGLLHSVVPGFP